MLVTNLVNGQKKQFKFIEIKKLSTSKTSYNGFFPALRYRFHSSSEPLTSGNDVISFVTPREKLVHLWCSPKHCAVGGQKLAITVLPSSFAPSPSPTWE
ncbi:hypothetical protein GBA52_010547 [Prunus armeniaca]|nr:hypothetical protein GBA52_010547 [Prunus armeniaca]